MVLYCVKYKIFELEKVYSFGEVLLHLKIIVDVNFYLKDPIKSIS